MNTKNGKIGAGIIGVEIGAAASLNRSKDCGTELIIDGSVRLN